MSRSEWKTNERRAVLEGEEGRLCLCAVFFAGVCLFVGLLLKIFLGFFFSPKRFDLAV